jgi:hypothetical protein
VNGDWCVEENIVQRVILTMWSDKYLVLWKSPNCLRDPTMEPTWEKLPHLFVQITNTWYKNDSSSIGEIWYPKCNSDPNQKASQAPLNNAIHSIHNSHKSWV